MELVYLWVEDYKNIKKQGFNFSPKFNCHYDSETLTIKDNIDENGKKQYIENFFGENINVTAIVGKNGSGKSSIVEIISLIRFKKFDEIGTNYLIFENKNILYIIFNKNFFTSIPHIKIINNTTCNTKETDLTDIFSNSDLFKLTMFADPLYNFLMQDSKYDVLKTFKYLGFYNGKYIHYEDRQNDIERHHELNSKYAYLLKDDDSFFDFLNENFLFNDMYLEIDTIKSIFILDNKNEFIKEISSFYNNNLDSKLNVAGPDLNYNKSDEKMEVICRFLSFYFLSKYISRFDYVSDTRKKREFLDKLLEEISSCINSQKTDKEKYIDILKLTKKYFKSFNNSIKNNLFEHNTLNKELKYVTKFMFLISIMKKNFELKKFEFNDFEIKIDFTLISKTYLINHQIIENFYKKINKVYLKEDKEPNNLQNTIVKDLYDWGVIKWEFFNQKKEYNYRKLSTGEKQLLEFLVNFAYTLKEMQNDKNSIIFIEEIEISMHPEWQKQLLNFIISIFKKLNLLNHKSLNYHLIFTTHSPFLLSDIPKQNIIFLDKDEKGNCKVVDGLQKEKKQTFGANIHTLLSDSFFMEDGLMGEFAKQKINKIIRFLNGKNRFIDFPIEQMEKVINTIGEPFLKQKLLDMYNKKFIKEYKDRQKEKIKKQIEDLNSQLKELDNDSNK